MNAVVHRGLLKIYMRIETRKAELARVAEKEGPNAPETLQASRRVDVAVCQLHTARKAICQVW